MDVVFAILNNKGFGVNYQTKLNIIPRQNDQINLNFLKEEETKRLKRNNKEWNGITGVVKQITLVKHSDWCYYIDIHCLIKKKTKTEDKSQITKDSFIDEYSSVKLINLLYPKFSCQSKFKDLENLDIIDFSTKRRGFGKKSIIELRNLCLQANVRLKN